MKQSLRKFTLTAHITLAVGWIGAVLAYLALVAAAMRSEDLLTLRAAWIGMDLIGWYVIVPLAIAALLTGLVMSLGTRWGLLRHYWVLTSLVLTTLATAVLLQHMPTVSALARAATEPIIGDVGALRLAVRGELLHSGLGLLVLIVVATLNVYKPLGRTPYGQGKVLERAVVRRLAPNIFREPARGRGVGTPRWVRVVGFHAIGLALLFVIMHLITGGVQHL